MLKQYSTSSTFKLMQKLLSILNPGQCWGQGITPATGWVGPYFWLYKVGRYVFVCKWKFIFIWKAMQQASLKTKGNLEIYNVVREENYFNKEITNSFHTPRLWGVSNSLSPTSYIRQELHCEKCFLWLDLRNSKHFEILFSLSSFFIYICAVVNNSPTEITSSRRPISGSLLMVTQVEAWENEKNCGNTGCMRVFPQLFVVLPNFHECYHNFMGKWYNFLFPL